MSYQLTERDYALIIKNRAERLARQAYLISDKSNELLPGRVDGMFDIVAEITNLLREMKDQR